MSVEQYVIDMTSILHRILSTYSTEKLSVHYYKTKEIWNIEGFKYLDDELLDRLDDHDFSVKYLYVDVLTGKITMGVRC